MKRAGGDRKRRGEGKNTQQDGAQQSASARSTRDRRVARAYRVAFRLIVAESELGRLGRVDLLNFEPPLHRVARHPPIHAGGRGAQLTTRARVRQRWLGARARRAPRRSTVYGPRASREGERSLHAPAALLLLFHEPTVEIRNIHAFTHRANTHCPRSTSASLAGLQPVFEVPVGIRVLALSRCRTLSL